MGMEYKGNDTVSGWGHCGPVGLSQKLGHIELYRIRCGSYNE